MTRLLLIVVVVVIAITIVGLLSMSSIVKALTEQEQVDKLTQKAKRLGNELHNTFTKITTCTNLAADKKNVKDDPIVRKCLKINMNWTDAAIDRMLGP